MGREGVFEVKFHFVEKKMDVSDALREYAQKKIGKLEKYFRQEADTQVTFAKEGARNIAEITVHAGGTYFRAKESTDDMYASIDSCISAIERQIHKNKSRLEKRLRQGAFEREIPTTMALPEVDEEHDFPIIRAKRFAFNPMTPEEAILQMNLLGHDFFVFRNFSADGGFAVVYRRMDGGYGLIEEE